MIIHELATNDAGLNYDSYNEADRSDITIPIVFLNTQVSNY